MRGVNDMKLNIIAERHEQHGDHTHSSRRDAPEKIARVVDRPPPLAPVTYRQPRQCTYQMKHKCLKPPVFGGLHLVSTPPSVSTPSIPIVMPSTTCQETVVSRSAQLLSHAMTLVETNPDAWCCLDGALTLLRGHLQESPANAASAAGMRQRSLTRWQSRAAIEYINANLASKLTLAEIAKVVCFCKSHFSRAFKISHGLSPWAYIIMARVERAKRMIRATREPLSQIASACGFADQAHLCRAFRRRVGVSPGIWRRAHLAVCTMDKGNGDTNQWSIALKPWTTQSNTLSLK
jgi:AraC family transcriptional regulator